MKNPPIVLLSDFGDTDIYSGLMKGVILGINPDAKIVDLTHNIEPQNIKQAAFALMNSFDFFPKGSIFNCVVDPGVGSQRDAIVLKADDKYLVGPNNGIFSYILDRHKLQYAVKISNQKFLLENISNTFHGRDVFAPVSGHLSKGTDIKELGELADISEIIRLSNLKVERISKTYYQAEIICKDRFGNLISTADRVFCDKLKKESENLLFKIADLSINGISNTYSDVGEGAALVYIGSSGFLEVGIRNGSFADQYKKHPIKEIKIHLIQKQ